MTGYFFCHNKFAFGEYVHEHSVVFKVGSVKYLQIKKFMLRGVRQKLTMADGGGRGGLDIPDITDKNAKNWQNI